MDGNKHTERKRHPPNTRIVAPYPKRFNVDSKTYQIYEATLKELDWGKEPCLKISKNTYSFDCGRLYWIKKVREDKDLSGRRKEE
jgi:hypothetical protein